jgi:hypothetical protein
VEDPTLCELLNGDIASLVGVNFGNKSLISCAYSIHLVLLDLGLCFVLIYVLELLCLDHLQKFRSTIAQFLIQLGSTVLSLIFNFV